MYAQTGVIPLINQPNGKSKVEMTKVHEFCYYVAAPRHSTAKTRHLPRRASFSQVHCEEPVNINRLDIVCLVYGQLCEQMSPEPRKIPAIFVPLSCF